MSLRRASIVLALALPILSPGCGNAPPSPDGGLPMADAGDAGPRDDAQILPDAQMPDAQVPDGGDGGGGTMVRTCPGASLPALASGVCEATAGDGNLLITGDILAPDQVLAGGQVLVDTTGTIVCVDCDCSSHALAAGATRLVCPDGVVSPGLVNSHDHITFQGNPPADTGDRSEQRHDWRRGLNGHLRISSMMATGEQMVWAELRQVMAGGTSLNGSGGQAGFLRNLDRTIQEGLGQEPVDYDTFPLGDSSGTQLASGCGYPSVTTTADIAADDAYTPHISEGIDDYAHNEFLCLSMGATDLIQPQTAFIHGIALLPGDIGAAANDGSMLIWSPRSNVFLYGDTARVREYDRMGVPIALGTDWVFSGSMNMLRELACADSLNTGYFDGYFSDEDLWRMATIHGAMATATDDVIGSIVVGRVADLAIFDGSVQTLHRAVIEAGAEDVALVLRSGVPLYGESAVVPLLRDGGACDVLDVCGNERRVCAMREIGMTLDALRAANAGSYPLFFCEGETIVNEPTCTPERMETLGSTYTGDRTAEDPDGDGVSSAMDNCPTVFNPARPMDHGAQSDVDGDGEGDSCDVCPLDPDTTTCTPPDPNDRDHDMVDDSVDNCPGVANMDQADADADGKGDACDMCPMDANPGSAPCPATIYDVKDGTVAIGTRVIVRGVVTAVAANGFYAQVPTGDPDYVGPDFSGVFVFTGTAPTVARGDLVSIDGAVARFPTTGTEYEIQFSRPTVTAGMGTAPVPDPVVVTPAEIATGGARAAALEAVLVRVTSVMVTASCATATCTALPPGGTETAPTYEFEVGGSLRVDDLMFRAAPFPVAGETFASITGVLTFRQSHSKLEPRDGDDFVAGSASLLALEPALSYAREGDAASPTFPSPLTVRLTRAVATATTVTIMSSAPGTLTATDVMVPAGASSVVVPVTAIAASASPVTITAQLGTDVRMAQVRVLGPTEAPTDFTLDPTSATVRVGTSATFTVTTDIPAPPGGATIALAEDTGGTLPASVVVPANETTATFSFTAGATAATGTLTATLGTAMHTAALTISAGVPGTIVINEIDYDQPSTDNAEFIELYNPGISAFDLTGVAVVLVNGSGGTEYARASLSGSIAPGEYIVIGVTGQTLTLPAGTRRIDVPMASGGGIQNGAPDGVMIIRTTDGALLDALSYEGAITSTAAIGGRTYSLVEGTALDSGVADAGGGSLARIPNGTDTDDASADWELVTRVTPGASNDGI